MAVLVIKCPHTNRPISTGIEVFRDFSQAPDVLSHLKCPECGLEHAWWTREAWLQDEGTRLLKPWLGEPILKTRQKPIYPLLGLA